MRQTINCGKARQGFFFCEAKSMTRDLKELEQKTGYHFKDFSLLERAMTHSSYANERHMPKYESNERLEFLGDAVLELISSEFLFSMNPEMPEGELTRTRASMVCEPALAFCARELALGKYIRLGKGEETSGGRRRDSITSDALEALIGAIYIDGGFDGAKEFINRHILKDLENKKLFFDSKTILQELVQGELEIKTPVTYQLINEKGPEHNKSFESAAYIDGKQYGTGKGKSKKAAEQEAAYHSILMLRKKMKK